MYFLHKILPYHFFRKVCDLWPENKLWAKLGQNFWGELRSAQKLPLKRNTGMVCPPRPTRKFLSIMSRKQHSPAPGEELWVFLEPFWESGSNSCPLVLLNLSCHTSPVQAYLECHYRLKLLSGAAGACLECFDLRSSFMFSLFCLQNAWCFHTLRLDPTKTDSIILIWKTSIRGIMPYLGTQDSPWS